MYYRRKLLLSLLQKSEKRQLGKINLQKVLFLITQEQKRGCFDFVPYRFGCFSFQANKDLSVLSRHYLLVDDEENHWILKNKEDYFSQLKKDDQKIVDNILSTLEVNNTSELIKYVYDIDPYFTIFSERTLTTTQKQNREKEIQKITAQKKQLFSIGYEGISIDFYLNLLIKNNVKLLCDVRKNPLSMKYGFSKNQLKKYCESINIQYIHIPNLGIDSYLRKNLNNQNDYDKLFKQYETGLQVKNESLEELKKLLNKYDRVAITCFEKDYNCCHRSILAKYYNQNIEEINPIHL